MQNEAGDVDEKQVAAVMLRRLMANDFIEFFSTVSLFGLFLFIHCYILTITLF